MFAYATAAWIIFHKPLALLPRITSRRLNEQFSDFNGEQERRRRSKRRIPNGRRGTEADTRDGQVCAGCFTSLKENSGKGEANN